eukprot:SAG22_NODE_15981_length_335_cov_1.076271_1_plen_34_part_10
MPKKDLASRRQIQGRVLLRSDATLLKVCHVRPAV